MALGITPVQSREAFTWSWKRVGKSYPDPDDHEAWNSNFWRKKVPTVFRPIDLPTSVILEFYKLPHDIPDYQPFSARLSFWYAKLFNPVRTHYNSRPVGTHYKCSPHGNCRKGRPEASGLVDKAVPNLEDWIERLKSKRSEEMQRVREM